MVKSLSILITSFITELAMADTLSGAEMDFSGITLDLVNNVIPTAVASIPEPSMLPLVAAGGAVAIAIKYDERSKSLHDSPFTRFGGFFIACISSVVNKRMPSFFRAGPIDQHKGELLLLI